MRKIILAAAMLAASFTAAIGAGYDLLNVGIDYFNQERYADAIVWLDKAIAAGDLIPDQMRVAYADRGLAHASQHEFESAISDYTAALALKPNDGFIARQRGLLYMAAGQYQNAVGDLAAAHLRYPDDLFIDFQTGLVNWRLGRYDDARTIFARLTHQEPTAWLWLQLSNVKSGAPLAPIEDKNFVPTQWPNPLKALYAGQMDEDAILRSQKNSRTMAGEACDAYFYIGEWRLAHGDIPAGKSMLQKAAEACENSSNEKALALFEIKNLDGTKK